MTGIDLNAPEEKRRSFCLELELLVSNDSIQNSWNNPTQTTTGQK
jgi:hypothetical protein